MFDSLPETAGEFMTWSWAQIEPYYDDLAAQALTAKTVANWLADWTRLLNLLGETRARLYVATTCDTSDQAAEQRYNAFMGTIAPSVELADQKLKEKLLASGLGAPGFETPLINMQAEVAIFRRSNLPLRTQERQLSTEYNKLAGAQTVQWNGNELTIPQLKVTYQSEDRALREQAWRTTVERQLADREATNALWVALIKVRDEQAANADCPDYRAFRWQQLVRSDYTPADCARFHQAIGSVAVPAARRIYEKRRRRLGLPRLRPWDLDIDPLGLSPLQPFDSLAELESTASAIFQRVDPQLGSYFEIMRREKLLDLENRRAKAPGAYCTSFWVQKRPFMFANIVGTHEDVRTILHEGGHAFHNFESSHLPYFQQRDVGAEFAEVASMGMELLAAPYLARSEGGFYSERDAARARLKLLEGIILFWPYMAVVDAFQHWAYTHRVDASDPKHCDETWWSLWQHFMVGVDWSGLEDGMNCGWQHKHHILRYPFYYIEYGLARLGAVQIWRNALRDRVLAVAQYRRALSLGGTLGLPELYAAAGARFAFDAATLRKAVSLIEHNIEELEEKIGGD
ncbi:MAG: M3 family oligoendopeptidase [Thermoflexales bacterium]|nr:M3 family oligoendopeptidase [Thermoflexales bacterium]